MVLEQLAIHMQNNEIGPFTPYTKFNSKWIKDHICKTVKILLFLLHLVNFFMVLGFELRASHLLCRCFYHLSHSVSPKNSFKNTGIVL
jgi:hypothetical protein